MTTKKQHGIIGLNKSQYQPVDFPQGYPLPTYLSQRTAIKRKPRRGMIPRFFHAVIISMPLSTLTFFLPAAGWRGRCVQTTVIVKNLFERCQNQRETIGWWIACKGIDQRSPSIRVLPEEKAFSAYAASAYGSPPMPISSRQIGECNSIITPDFHTLEFWFRVVGRF